MTLSNWAKISKSFRTAMAEVMNKLEGNWEAKFSLENDSGSSSVLHSRLYRT